MRMAAYLATGAGADFAPTMTPLLGDPLRTLLDGPASRLAMVQATLALPEPASVADSLKFATAVGASCARPRNDHRSFPTSEFGEFPGGRPQVAPTSRKTTLDSVGASAGRPDRHTVERNRKGAPRSQRASWGEEEQGSTRRFPQPGEPELSGLCSDDDAPPLESPPDPAGRPGLTVGQGASDPGPAGTCVCGGLIEICDCCRGELRSPAERPQVVPYIRIR